LPDAVTRYGNYRDDGILDLNLPPDEYKASTLTAGPLSHTAEGVPKSIL